MDPCRDMRIFSRVSSASGISHQVSSQAAGAGSCKRLQLAKAYSYDFSLLLFGIPKQRAPVDHPTSGRPVTSVHKAAVVVSSIVALGNYYILLHPVRFAGSAESAAIQQCFSLTTNQRTVLSATIYQRNKQATRCSTGPCM
jgi:hypothetical protein